MHHLRAHSSGCRQQVFQRPIERLLKCDFKHRGSNKSCPGQSLGILCVKSVNAVLEDWIQEQGGQMPTKLSLSQQSLNNFTMVCKESLEKGRTLIRLPRKILMTIETARKAQDYGHIVDSAALSEWQALILHLICERARGKDSFWAPFISALPDQAQHPLLWDEEHLKWLTGSPMSSVLHDRQSQVVEDRDAILKAIPQDTLMGQPKEDLISLDLVRWAAATLLSRAFSLDLADDMEGMEGDMSYFGSWQPTSQVNDTLALVPWVDMMHHCSQAGPESCLRFSFEIDAVMLSAHRAYTEGSEVFCSFGPNLSPIDLLLDYGTSDEGNPNSKVELPTKVVAAPSSARSRALLEALSRVQGEDSKLVLSPRGPDITTVAWVRAALATDAELIKAGWRYKATAEDVELACRVMGTLSDPISKQNESKVLAAFSAAAMEQLSSYPTSLEQDEEEERDPLTGMTRRHVLRALISEKRSLVGTISVIKEWTMKLEAGLPLEELYADWDWGNEGDVYPTWEDEEEGDEEERPQA
ncbi:hypothetical protein CEUSTIGMA_g5881.t1 [Chlamydomonas eustigma]|uniref:Rubisco LSMT substrate-binding domain-containing protein n=1 Tax=Chlamydomonas eustigma TaxID=1157962 RepID=A0A250X6P9_9CHLO|nr:hypothetical protein CEUSTIGMA_g5881.t1 [Chlamydomonas eustigma]|eukprot:GAX78440.1 hypothetical protein CEUSTIGMA_g5881.t1 [Chlamydomonas eustigma]